MGFLDRFKKKNKQEEPFKMYLYSEKDYEIVEKTYDDKIGNYSTVFHEVASLDLHLDVIPIPPSKEREYYTFITLGMGAYKMPVPDIYKRMNRAEIAIKLPKDWDLQSTDEKWYWPIRTIKTLARMPLYENSWLGCSHDFDFGEPFTEETELCGILLDFYDEEIEPITLECGDQVIIYNAIPIYRSEMEYKNNNSAELLLEKMNKDTIYGPVDIHRKSVV